MQWKSNMSLFLVALCCFLAVSCATIFKSKYKSFGFRSNPDAAEILIGGESKGYTPLELKLNPKKTYLVTFRKPGFEDATVSLDTHVQPGWVILDIFAGVIGIAVDAATGNWKAFNENERYVVLNKRAQ